MIGPLNEKLNSSLIESNTVDKLERFLIAINLLSNIGILVLNETFTVVNANTSSDAVNNFFTAFINLFNSNGWIAIDTFVNTLGNSLSSYDAIGGGIARLETRKIRKKEAEEAEDDTKEKMIASFDKMNNQLGSINKLLREINCRSLDIMDESIFERRQQECIQ